jgi:hypothetical protein
MSVGGGFGISKNVLGGGGGGGGSIDTKNVLWGLITNFAAGSNPEFVDWAGVLSPTGTHNSALPIPFDLTIKRITLKYLDTTAASVDATFNYEISIGKLNNPSGISDNTNYVDYAGGANVLTLTNANINGNFFLLEASALNILVNAGDVIMVRGNVTAGSSLGGSNEEVMVSVEYEKSYASGGGGGADEKVKVNGSDSTADFLENKVSGDYTMQIATDTTNPSYTSKFQAIVSRYDNVGVTNNYSSGGATTLGGFANVGSYGSENTAVGVNVFNVASGLTNSVGVGSNIAIRLVTANQITAIGHNALINLATSGDEQIAIGSGALSTNVGLGVGVLTGDFNVAVGTDSMANLNTGYRNTALGHNSGGALTTGARNIVLGFEAGLSALNNLTSNNDNILLGYQADTDGDENIVIGNNANTQVGSVTANQNTVIGINASVNSTLQIVIGYDADIQNGGQDVLIGVNSTIDGSSFPTFPTLSSHVGSAGTFVGFYNQSLGYNQTITGEDNCAVGNFNTITGNDNISIGNSLTMATTQTYGLGVDSSSFVDYSLQVSWNNGSQFDDIRLVSKASPTVGQKSFINVKSDLAIDAVGGVLISTGDLQTAKQLRQNNFLLGTLTVATTLDWSNGNIQEFTLGANITLNNPTNTGQSVYYLIVTQDATGSRTITWDTNWKWASGTPPTLTTNPARKDILMFVSDGVNIFGSVFGQLYV